MMVSPASDALYYPLSVRTYPDIKAVLTGKPIPIFVCGVRGGGTTSLPAHFCEHPAMPP